jgi:hypothetical protein
VCDRAHTPTSELSMTESPLLGSEESLRYKTVPWYPQCRWVPVVDAAGRRSLEMRWSTPAPAAQPAPRTA